jgi:hypothetical protein
MVGSILKMAICALVSMREKKASLPPELRQFSIKTVADADVRKLYPAAARSGKR